MASMRQWVLASRPKGAAKESDFRLEVVPVPAIDKGQALLRTLYLGVAPVMLRYMLNDTEFEKPLSIGEVMRGRGVGRVVESRNPQFAVGDIVQCRLGWREYGVIESDPYYMAYRMAQTDLPASYGAGSLSMTGFTALIGLRDIGLVKRGDRVLVSGAAGGVGSHVGFIAKALGGGPVIGIAGGPDKCRLLTERLAYDDAIDYKNHNVSECIDALLPDGVDVFFDNVGGALLDDVLARIRRHARVVICGRIAEYLQAPEDRHRYRNIHRIGRQDAKMEAFFVFDYHAHFTEYEQTLALWIREGKMNPLQDVLDGIENMPRALISLYEGGNAGVRMVRIDPEA